MFNSDLVDDLARRRAVLFLGAGVSSSASTISGRRLEGWERFLVRVAQQASPSVRGQVDDLISARDYLLACELLRNDRGDQWNSLVQAEYNQAAEPSDLHRAIVGLDQRIIITTNFDKLLESSWVVKLGIASRYPVILSNLDDDAFRMLRDHDNRYLVKLHGTIDRPDELIFAKSQYQQRAFASSQYNSFLESVFLNFTVVFVGFSMNDPAVSLTIEQYAYRYPKCRPHYAFQEAPVAQNIIDMSKRLRKLNIIQYGASSNHAALPIMLENLNEQVETRRKEIIADNMA
jgi:hypothetical protein